MANDDDSLEAQLYAALNSAAEPHKPLIARADPLHLSHELLSFPQASSATHSYPTPVSAPIHHPNLPTFASVAEADAQQLSELSDLKHPREADLFGEEHEAKRQRTEQEFLAALKAEPEHGETDLEAMLQNALASYDGINPVPDAADDGAAPAAPVAPAAPEPAPARSRTASPGRENVEDRIMKASSNSAYMIRAMSLPVLGSVAVQILLRLSQQSRHETEVLLADQDSEFRRDYQSLISMFLPARKVFSNSPLFFPEELDISDSDDCETIRMSNLATTAASTFGANDVTLADVHKSFFSIFVPEDSGYKSSLTDLFVNLKTRVFTDDLNELEESQHVTSLLDYFFPADFGVLLKQRSGDVVLNADEELLVARVGERREALLKSVNDEHIRSHVIAQYPLDQFAEDFSTFLRGHLSMVVEYADKYGVNIPLSQEEPVTTQPHDQSQEHEQSDLASLLQYNLAQSGMLNHVDTENFLADMSNSFDPGMELSQLIRQSLASQKVETHDEQLGQETANDAPDSSIPKDLASLITEKLAGSLDKLPDGLPGLQPPYTNSNHDPSHGESLGQGMAFEYSSPAVAHPQFLARMNQLASSTYQQYAPPAAPTHSTGANGEHLPPNQTSPTSVLYERARQAAVAKSSNTARREGLHSTRRPWTPEEEKALMAGLDMVKGPHWSQILSLFGANGSISDILKDRTQVQLKDKARNLKLFFLKTNSEMPYYLQSVTGELKTRAPSQAARKEAEEKARQNLEEEQARIQGIMTLTGLQHNPHHIGNNSLANSPSARGSPMNSAPLGMANTSAASNSGQTNGTSAPPIPISPLVKSEVQEHHQLHQLSKLPPIQPAPAPAAVAAPAPMAPIQAPLKPQQQSSHRVHQTPTHQQQLLPAAPPPRAQPHSQAHASTVNSQNYGLPPIPPNHHSTPDQVQDAHAQDAKLFEALSAAVADPTENHLPGVVAEALVN